MTTFLHTCARYPEARCAACETFKQGIHMESVVLEFSGTPIVVDDDLAISDYWAVGDFGAATGAIRVMANRRELLKLPLRLLQFAGEGCSREEVVHRIEKLLEDARVADSLGAPSALEAFMMTVRAARGQRLSREEAEKALADAPPGLQSLIGELFDPQDRMVAALEQFSRRGFRPKTHTLFARDDTLNIEGVPPGLTIYLGGIRRERVR